MSPCICVARDLKTDIDGVECRPAAATLIYWFLSYLFVRVRVPNRPIHNLNS